MPAVKRLLELMAALRDPVTGCDWDIQQDFQSLTRYTIEEAYEVVDAVERGNSIDLRDELGDLLLQVVFYSQIASEQQLFDFQAVADGLADKLVRRHPHIFGDLQLENQVQRKQVWEQVKADERAQKSSVARSSRLDDIGKAQPALMQATKIQQRAANSGFDWQTVEPVIDKIREELDEVIEARASGEHDAIEDEIGDLIFAVVNLARHSQVDAETALRCASQKFTRRFQGIEQHLEEQQLLMEQMELAELDRLWDRVKVEQQ